jgi:hypothetical protein
MQTEMHKVAAVNFVHLPGVKTAITRWNSCGEFPKISDWVHPPTLQEKRINTKQINE